MRAGKWAYKACQYRRVARQSASDAKHRTCISLLQLRLHTLSAFLIPEKYGVRLVLEGGHAGLLITGGVVEQVRVGGVGAINRSPHVVSFIFNSVNSL